MVLVGILTLVLAWFYACGFTCFVFVNALSGVLVDVLGFVILDQLGSVLVRLLIFVPVKAHFQHLNSNLTFLQ